MVIAYKLGGAESSSEDSDDVDVTNSSSDDEADLRSQSVKSARRVHNQKYNMPN